LKEIRKVTGSMQQQRLVSGSGKAVLFVDDEEIIRGIGKQMLESEGYRVFTARDGIEALEVFESNRADVRCVVLDMVMPRMNGVQAFRQLRRTAPELGIVLITGCGERRLQRDLADCGYMGF
jgi:CheY-like chemotaxis protein